MLAIIQSGGKQYKVKPNTKLNVEYLGVEEGSTIELKDILLLQQSENDIKIGAPYVNNASVKAKILSNFRSDKIIVFKKKQRKNYRRKHGHKQLMSAIQITDIISN